MINYAIVPSIYIVRIGYFIQFFLFFFEHVTRSLSSYGLNSNLKRHWCMPIDEGAINRHSFACICPQLCRPRGLEMVDGAVTEAKKQAKRCISWK